MNEIYQLTYYSCLQCFGFGCTALMAGRSYSVYWDNTAKCILYTLWRKKQVQQQKESSLVLMIKYSVRFRV